MLMRSHNPITASADWPADVEPQRMSTPFGRRSSAASLKTSQMPRFHDAVAQRRDRAEQRARKHRQHRIGAFDEDASVTVRRRRTSEIHPARGRTCSARSAAFGHLERIRTCSQATVLPPRPSGTVSTRSRSGSTAATTNASAAPGIAGITSPAATV